jgi:AcrR family transcriptional regulator
MIVGISIEGMMQETRTEISDTSPAARGRPRDPQIEARIFDAALTLYGRQGWLGFSLDGVARGARVSKDAMYRRWKTRETLLQDALHQRWDWVATIDEGNVRSDLRKLGARTFDTFAGPYGEVALQLRADARRFSEVRRFAEPYRELMVHQGRGIVRLAIQRGDLPPAVNPGMIMDLLIGSIINHIISTPRRLRDAMIEGGPHFVSTIVDLVLAGVHHILFEEPHG